MPETFTTPAAASQRGKGMILFFAKAPCDDIDLDHVTPQKAVEPARRRLPEAVVGERDLEKATAEKMDRSSEVCPETTVDDVPISPVVHDFAERLKAVFGPGGEPEAPRRNSVASDLRAAGPETSTPAAAALRCKGKTLFFGWRFAKSPCDDINLDDETPQKAVEDAAVGECALEKVTAEKMDHSREVRPEAKVDDVPISPVAREFAKRLKAVFGPGGEPEAPRRGGISLSSLDPAWKLVFLSPESTVTPTRLTF